MCHSERSVSEVEPAGQRLAVGIPKRKVSITTYFTPPDYTQGSLCKRHVVAFDIN